MKTLDQLLETWSVLPPGMWENETGPKNWYAVVNDDGIIAYFSDYSYANAFRLHMINGELISEIWILEKKNED